MGNGFDPFARTLPRDVPGHATRGLSMFRFLPAALILLSLVACNRNADQPENATDAAPSQAEPSATTSDTPAPSGNDSADATATGTATSAEASVAGDAAAGGPTGPIGQSDATLDADLMACDALPAADQAGCRSDAQARYSERAAGGTAEEATPVEQP
jgi:cytoskeletal protein RodZ